MNRIVSLMIAIFCISFVATATERNTTINTSKMNEVTIVSNPEKQINLLPEESIKLPNKLMKKLVAANPEDVKAPSKGLLYVLCIFIPFLAVGLKTDWGKEVLFNILWTILGVLPAISHAFIVCSR